MSLEAWTSPGQWYRGAEPSLKKGEKEQFLVV